MYALYSFLLFISLVFMVPYYFFQRSLLRGEPLFLRKRLGQGLPKQSKEQAIWIHAVSVGEVLSLQNLVQELRAKHSSLKINFSSLTNTGFRVAKEKLKGADNIFFIPFDFACIVRKFFKALGPELLVLAESEFWPNLLRVAKKQNCPVILINGRISEKSFRRYLRFKLLFKKMWSNVSLFLVQTEQDKERLEKIGISSSRVEVAGNLKAEIEPPLLTDKEILSIKRNLNIQRGKKVIVAGSTRKGEEEKLLNAFSKAKEVMDDLLLILAPRHPQRFAEVEKICRNYPFIVRKKSRVSLEEKWEILILDTMGELAQFYALSDIAFVGGSLVPWGGHNLLEPAFYKKPVFFGPYMKNFGYLAEKFVQSGAARIIHDQNDLIEMFLVNDEKIFSEMGKKAEETLNSLRGATNRAVEAIESVMKGVNQISK